MTDLKNSSPHVARSADGGNGTALLAPRAPRRARHSKSETLLARVVTRMVDLAVAEGMDRDALLNAAGLRGVDLSDGDARVPLSSQVALWHLLSKGMPDTGFGVRMGAAFKVRDAGLLGYVMLFSANLGTAIDRFVRYSRVLNDGVEWTLVRPQPGQIAVVQAYPEPGATPAIAVDCRLAALVNACRQLTGEDIVPYEVDFAYDQRKSTLEHRRFFRSTLQFGQPASRVVFLERDLRLPVRQADETLAGYLSSHADQVLRALVTGSTIRERVRSAIWNSLSDGRPTLPRIAAELRLTPRTLQRHLSREGTSLHGEVDEVRKAMAMAMLRDRSIPIDEVAFLLGYSEPSTLFRSFKRWSGMTPHEYRARSRDSSETNDESAWPPAIVRAPSSHPT